MADGQVVDFDGKEVAPASAYGKAFYDNFVGYASNANPTASVRGGVLAAAKGAGDTVPCKIGTDGKLYVPTYPYEMLGFVSEVDSVINGLPTLYVDGDFWVKQLAGADELYVAASGAWVASTDTFSEAAEAPAEPTDGDYYYDTATSKLMKYVTDTWAEVTDHQYVRSETAPVFYADGYVIADQSTKKIYTKDETWGDGVSLASGKLYTDGTDLYVYGSGSLAKI